MQHLRLLARPALIAAVVSAVGVVVVRAIGVGLLDASMGVTINEESSSVEVGNAVSFTIFVIVAGTLLAALLASYVADPARWFIIASGTFFILMLGGPLAGADDTATTITLIAMHVVVLAATLWQLVPALRGRTSKT